MNRLLLYGLAALGLYTIIGGSFSPFDSTRIQNLASLFDGISQNEMTATILDHYKKNVLQNDQNFVADTIDTTITDLNDDGKKDVIAIVESAPTCGSGGCIASIFIKNELGELAAIPFMYAVKHIEVLESITKGMHDLRVNHDETQRIVWDGTSYVPEQI